MPNYSASVSVAPAHEFQAPPPPQRAHPPAFNRLSSPTFVNREDVSLSVSAFSPQDPMRPLPVAALGLLPPANRFQNSVVDCLTLAGTNYPTSVQIECAAMHRNQQHASGIAPLGLLPPAQAPAAAALVPVPFSNASTSTIEAALVTPQAPLETIRVLFQCPADDCSQRFDSQGALREHIRKHLSGELPSQLFGLLPSAATAATAFSNSPPQPPQLSATALGFRAAPPPPPHPTPALSSQPNANGQQYFVPDASVAVTPSRRANCAPFDFLTATQPAATNAPPPPSDPSVFSDSMNPLLADESLVFGQLGLSDIDQSSLLNALNLMAPYNEMGSLLASASFEPPAPPFSEYMTWTPLPAGVALHSSFTSSMQPASGERAAAANGGGARSTHLTSMTLTPNVSALTLPNVGNARSRVPSNRLMSPPAPYAVSASPYCPSTLLVLCLYLARFASLFHDYEYSTL